MVLQAGAAARHGLVRRGGPFHVVVYLSMSCNTGN